MGLSPKIRVNPRNPWLKIKKSAVKNNKIRANLRIKTVSFVNFFMQNKPKLQKTEIALSLYMANGYINLSAKSAVKNKAKTKPNQTQF
jgi:hypothetical protein